jgi:2-oxoglutarate/2-oxoacid ferredoxin oxidoreductase subunit alpha
MLSDQFLGQARAVIDTPELEASPALRKLTDPDAPDYQRFALTDNGVSPMAIPGNPGTAYTATGLSHQASGRPSTVAGDHLAQLEKRRHKLHVHEYGPRWADIEGDGELAIITFGSVTGACREAIARLAETGLAIRLVSLRLLAPLQAKALAQALQGVKRTLVVEQNHGAQLYRYLRAETDLPGDLLSLAQPGPLPLKPGEIVSAMNQLNQEQAA